MKNLTIICLAIWLVVGCSEKSSEATKIPESVTYPVDLTYPGTPTLGNFDHVKTVLESNKRLTELNANIGEFMADSVVMHLADGSEISGPRDSVLVAISGFIGSLKSLEIKFVAAIPIRNAEQNHDWVLAWTDETHNYKDGSVVIQSLHEDYRMENGKIREIFQYTRQLPKKKIE
jgi:hypothetical protein